MGYTRIIGRNSLYKNLPSHMWQLCICYRVNNERITRWFSKARLGRLEGPGLIFWLIYRASFRVHVDLRASFRFDVDL